MKTRSTIRIAAAATFALGMTAVVPTASSAQSFGPPGDPWCFGIQNLSEFLASGGTCKSGYPHFSGSTTMDECPVEDTGSDAAHEDSSVLDWEFLKVNEYAPLQLSAEETADWSILSANGGDYPSHCFD